jgi:hypothetical protein
MVLAREDCRECEGRSATDRLDCDGDEKSMPENRRSKGMSAPRRTDRSVEFREEGSGEDARDS